MYVKANPVLCKIFLASKLSLNDHGLLYRIRDDSNFYFNVTQDHVKIAELAGFDYVELDAAKTEKEFFALLSKNPYFNPSYYCNYKPSNKKGSTMLRDLSIYLQKNPMKKDSTKRSVEEFFDALKDFNFKERYEKLNVLYKNKVEINKKLSGTVILKHIPSYDKRHLEQGFLKFNHNHFSSMLERLEFLHDHTEEEIVQEFVKINNLN